VVSEDEHAFAGMSGDSKAGRRWTAPPVRTQSNSLRVGLARSDEFTVTDRLLTDVGGSIAVAVLSTPGMVAMMERNAARLSLEHLPEGQATVGFEICIRHVAAALEGARCQVSAKLTEIVDRRKLRFDVEVRELATSSERRLIGVGTHERRIIDVARHASRAGG
jgi:predicted thioesterase